MITATSTKRSYDISYKSSKLNEKKQYPEYEVHVENECGHWHISFCSGSEMPFIFELMEIIEDIRGKNKEIKDEINEVFLELKNEEKALYIPGAGSSAELLEILSDKIRVN